MDAIIEKINQYIMDTLQGWVLANLNNMFTNVNAKVSTIADQTSLTPLNWNSNVFDMVKGLSDTVILPIAGMIISFIVVYELISMVVDKNNMRDFDTGLFFRFFFKACIAVVLLSYCFDVVLAVFDVGSHIVLSAGAEISNTTNIDVNARIMEILLYISIAPIPFATFINREWGNIGTNYVRSLCALAFQGFFIMVCVGIYAALVSAITLNDNIHYALWETAACTVVLCFCLFKTDNIARSIWNAH